MVTLCALSGFNAAIMLALCLELISDSDIIKKDRRS